MTLTGGLGSSPELLVPLTGLVGLLVGSFLNVVSMRLPTIMKLGWQREAREILKIEPEWTAVETPPTLWSPPSSCPHCGARIRPWHNVPVFGWLWLRGRCADCHAPISVQYPLVELACGVISMICAWRFGWSIQFAAALLLSWTLLVLAVIDLRTRMLPDSITLPLLWLGLLLSVWQVYCTSAAAILGAAAGYLLLWSVYQLFRLATGKEGMGFGDFKLLAAIGAWLGIVTLPMVLLLASVVGASVGVGLIVLRKQGRSVPIAFGPYLAAAGWVVLIWGSSLLNMGLHLGAAG